MHNFFALISTFGMADGWTKRISKQTKINKITHYNIPDITNTNLLDVLQPIVMIEHNRKTIQKWNVLLKRGSDGNILFVNKHLLLNKSKTSNAKHY